MTFTGPTIKMELANFFSTLKNPPFTNQNHEKSFYQKTNGQQSRDEKIDLQKSAFRCTISILFL